MIGLHLALIFDPRPDFAMQRYLADMSFDAHSMSEWTRPWGQPEGGQTTGRQPHAALLQDRWQRIAAKEDAQGASDGLDWTVARKMLKESAVPLFEATL